MFIVRASKQNRFKPRRGAMSRSGAAHAAPTGLGRVVERGVTINMSPRWGLASPGACRTPPSEAAAADGGMAVLSAFGGAWSAAAEPGRYARS